MKIFSSKKSVLMRLPALFAVAAITLLIITTYLQLRRPQTIDEVYAHLAAEPAPLHTTHTLTTRYSSMVFGNDGPLIEFLGIEGEEKNIGARIRLYNQGEMQEVIMNLQDNTMVEFQEYVITLLSLNTAGNVNGQEPVIEIYVQRVYDPMGPEKLYID